jgi:hypothetical protein
MAIPLTPIRHFINSSITLAASLSKLIESITAGDDYGKK